jgi:membrane-associated phospholipid phosphatase
VGGWLQWGTDWIVALQGGGWLATQAMHAFTFLGSELFYMLVMPTVLWCFSTSLGLRLGLALLTSTCLNTVIKLACGLPRPFWIDARVRALSVETSFGLPSGHAQNAVVLWGYLAYRLRRWWITLLVILLILGISFSRIYLGVHFPGDVVIGWIIGGLLLVLFIVLEDPVARWLERRRLSVRLAAAVAFSLGLLGLGWLAAQAAAGRVLPPEWAVNFARATGGAEWRPFSMTDLISGTAALMGFGVGAVLLADWGQFRNERRGWWRAARFLVGVIGVLALQVGLDALLPGGEAFRFARYALVGLWIAYGAPRLFVALGMG